MSRLKFNDGEEFDSLNRNGKNKSQTHVICKLLVLVREQVKRDLVLPK